MPPKSDNKRVRIGLTLAPDVAAILNEHGRSETQIRRFRCSGCGKTVVSAQDISGDSHDTVPNAVCSGVTSLEPIDLPLRPTRTQIIETAVRVYDLLGGFQPGFDLANLTRTERKGEPVRPLARKTVQPLPKPGKR